MATKVRASLLSIAVLLVILGVFGGQPVHATLLTLSTHTSDPAVAVDVLDAVFDFTVVDDLTYGQVLELAVTNTTGQNEDAAFIIDAIWFNVPEDVVGMDFFAASDNYGQWKKDTAYSQDAFNADGFANFDMVVTDNKVAIIIPGQTVTFSFGIDSLGTYTGADFANLMSQDTGNPMYAAARFKTVVDDPGVCGATNVVPEPATLCLLGLGGLAMLRRRKSA